MALLTCNHVLKIDKNLSTLYYYYRNEKSTIEMDFFVRGVDSLIPLEVKAGDNVIYSKYAGTEVKLDDVSYIIVKESDILAIIK